MINRRPQLSINSIPGQVSLWLAIAIFGSSSAVTRRLTQLGAQHLVGDRNPISLCNVLFVGNLCALLLLVIIHRRQLNGSTIRHLTRRQWAGLISVTVLAGALAPALMFQALSLTNVNNIVLVGRLEPPLTLALSVWLLRERVNIWQIGGAIAALIGVTLTIGLHSPLTNRVGMAGFTLGTGELLAAVGAVALAIATITGRKLLVGVQVGLFSTFRTAIGTLIFFNLAMVLYGKDHFADAFTPFLWEWMLLYGAVIVVLGQSFWINGLKSSTISEASLIASCTPIIGIVAAFLILGEAPTFAQYLGGGVILIGVVLSQIGMHYQHSRSAKMTGKNWLLMEQVLATQTGFRGL
jgi:drug/metabolite transporter (DMT)-like permease